MLLCDQFNTNRVKLVRSKQFTLRRLVSATGVGLFSGETISMTLCPAAPGQGIVFERVDLPDRPRITASIENVQRTPRCTIIGNERASVQTVEHLLAALRALGADDVLVQLSGVEIPVFDGSSRVFVEMLEEAGLVEQAREKEVLHLKEPIFFSQGQAHIVALPAEEYRISYTLHYPHCPIIGTQFHTLCLTPDSFKEEIALSRTFSIYEEIAPMIERGLVKGGSLDSAVLIEEGRIVNPGGLRYENEMVRHKILDLIGDFSLLPSFSAHIIAICSGHASNNAFAKHFINYVKTENL